MSAETIRLNNLLIYYCVSTTNSPAVDQGYYSSRKVDSRPNRLIIYNNIYIYLFSFSLKV